MRNTVSWLKSKFILRLHNGGRACLSTVLFTLGLGLLFDLRWGDRRTFFSS